jgi:transposase-like protein
MAVEFACSSQKPITQKAVAYDFGRPKCPRCGSVLLIAEESAFNLRGRIRHAWSCDHCAHEFVTSIILWPR